MLREVLVAGTDSGSRQSGERVIMAEYGMIASKSAEFLTGAFGQMQNLLDAIPYGSPLAIGVSVAALFYLFLRRR
jgi:hypothetical protein